jgi:[2Fe-2S] binding domain
VRPSHAHLCSERKRRCKNSGCFCGPSSALGSARYFATNRHETRLRCRIVWGMQRPRRWRIDSLLHNAGVAGWGQEHQDHRRTRDERFASASTGVDRGRRSSVRLLPERTDHGSWSLLAKTPHPSDDEITEYMSGNICRCGTYERIRRAIHRAANAGGAK